MASQPSVFDPLNRMDPGGISPAYLRERLRYDPETGKLFWRVHPSMPDWWNARYGTAEAFTALNKAGYRTGAVDSISLIAHRVIWAMVHDSWPEVQIDHEDHDRANNRIGNLRSTDRVGNMRNASRAANNTSGVTGVDWCSAGGRWRAQITVRQRRLYLGLFHDFDAAVAARKAAEREHGFHPNHGTPQEVK